MNASNRRIDSWPRTKPCVNVGVKEKSVMVDVMLFPEVHRYCASIVQKKL